jgi:valyl-tRNA synthetase
MHVDRIEPGLRPGSKAFQTMTLEDRWILSRFNRVTRDVNDALTTYRFHEAANRIYDFFWGDFCDWYIELIKPRLFDESGAAPIACANLVNLYDSALRLLHPIMPFITEEIWQALYDGVPPLKSIALASFPQANHDQIDLNSETEMAILQDLIVSIRNLRAELKVEQKLRIPVQMFAEDAAVRSLIEKNVNAVERLANVASLTFVHESLSKLPGSRHTARFEVHVIYEKKIDVAVERERLEKELEKIEKEIINAQRQLTNEQFLAKAPVQVVGDIRKRAAELSVLQEKTQNKLEELEGS